MHITEKVKIRPYLRPKTHSQVSWRFYEIAVSLTTKKKYKLTSLRTLKRENQYKCRT